MVGFELFLVSSNKGKLAIAKMIIMNTNRQFTDKDLCAALSDIFVDNLTDYQHIASVAKHFPIEHVERMLTRYVAPVCYTNMLTPVPPVWLFFDEDDVWNDICVLKTKERSFLGKFKRDLCTLYFKNNLKHEWRELVQLLQNQPV
ncbi:hypothetical protein QS795_000480 [Providencia zhijiangensis]|uniref:DUF7079 domain-containing protein n=1 Tax=Providencia zhijiangensis TaxID=3053982 RepID=A0ABZ0N1M5_9GAMM|nr:hypothetical protein [Providencia sp. D4759]WPA92287.1 hypothetical protein QS795_000480 [Providencia sp. D4759]